MRIQTPLLVLLSTFFLVSCSTAGKSLSLENKNPLTASRYGDELADNLADLIIQSDPIVQKEGVQDLIRTHIQEGKDIANDARALQQKGMMGTLIGVKQAVIGSALYVDDIVYLSPDFETDPGPALHVYLSTVVDPRDGAFPDDTALDLGEIQTAYGASSYAVPAQKNPELFRSLVLYDTALDRIYSFAQLSKGSL